MTERQLLDLGFEKQEETDGVDGYYYYTLTIAQGFEFITNANDETDHEDDWCVEYFESDQSDWYVEYFNSNPTIRWKDAEDVRLMLEVINKGERV